MESLEFAQVGFLFVGLVIIGGVAISVKKMGREQALEANKIITDFTNQITAVQEKFNVSIKTLDLTISSLQKTIDYINRDLEKNSNRISSHGKELDKNSTAIAVHEKILERQEEKVKG